MGRDAAAASSWETGPATPPPRCPLPEASRAAQDKNFSKNSGPGPRAGAPRVPGQGVAGEERGPAPLRPYLPRGGCARARMLSGGSLLFLSSSSSPPGPGGSPRSFYTGFARVGAGRELPGRATPPSPGRGAGTGGALPGRSGAGQRADVSGKGAGPRPRRPGLAPSCRRTHLASGRGGFN